MIGKSKYWLLLVSFCVFFLSHGKVSAQKSPDEIIGYYYYFETKEKEHTQVEVYKSGNKYMAKVAWLKVPNTPDGKAKTDIFNKDKTKNHRLIIGLPIFDGLTYNKNKHRWEGTIYDPAHGESFKCVVWFESKDVLKIKGYAGAEWMGLNKTITWKKEAGKRTE